MQNLINEFHKWIKAQVIFEEMKDFVEITTPFVDMHNDLIQVYLSKEGNSFRLTDDGRIVDELEMLGANPKSSKKRQAIFDSTLRTFGIHHDSKTLELYIDFKDTKEFPVAHHQLVQCLLRISDMFMLSRNTVANIFSEDLKTYFEQEEVAYTKEPSFMGISGVAHTFDFSIPKFKDKTPKLVRAINNLNRNQARDTLFSWLDLRDIRTDHELFVIINDNEKTVSHSALQMFDGYKQDRVSVHMWNQKEVWIPQLKIV